MKDREYRFFYHYNKPAGRMSVHFRNKCHIVDNIDCQVPASTKWNKTQPRVVMQGFARKVRITKGGTTVIE